MAQRIVQAYEQLTPDEQSALQKVVANTYGSNGRALGMVKDKLSSDPLYAKQMLQRHGYRIGVESQTGITDVQEGMSYDQDIARSLNDGQEAKPAAKPAAPAKATQTGSSGNAGAAKGTPAPAGRSAAASQRLATFTQPNGVTPNTQPAPAMTETPNAPSNGDNSSLIAGAAGAAMLGATGYAIYRALTARGGMDDATAVQAARAVEAEPQKAAQIVGPEIAGLLPKLQMSVSDAEFSEVPQPGQIESAENAPRLAPPQGKLPPPNAALPPPPPPSGAPSSPQSPSPTPAAPTPVDDMVNDIMEQDGSGTPATQQGVRVPNTPSADPAQDYYFKRFDEMVRLEGMHPDTARLQLAQEINAMKTRGLSKPGAPYQPPKPGYVPPTSMTTHPGMHPRVKVQAP